MIGGYPLQQFCDDQPAQPARRPRDGNSHNTNLPKQQRRWNVWYLQGHKDGAFGRRYRQPKAPLLCSGYGQPSESDDGR